MLVAVIVATASCGRNEPSTESSTPTDRSADTVILPPSVVPPDPCQLVTDDEVAEALAYRVSAGYPKNAAPRSLFGNRSCFWQTDPAGAGLATLEVETTDALAATAGQRFGQTTTAAQEFDSFPSNPQVEVSPVDGLGSRAKWWRTGSTTSVAVLANETYLKLDLLDLPAGQQARAFDLAQLAVDRLPVPSSTGPSNRVSATTTRRR